jgi:hypothetical protein
VKKQVKLITGSYVTINMIASLLEQNAIFYLINNNIESARLAGFGSLNNDVDLFVYEEDLNTARQIVEDFQ